MSEIYFDGIPKKRHYDDENFTGTLINHHYIIITIFVSLIMNFCVFDWLCSFFQIYFSTSKGGVSPHNLLMQLF